MPENSFIKSIQDIYFWKVWGSFQDSLTPIFLPEANTVNNLRCHIILFIYKWQTNWPNIYSIASFCFIVFMCIYHTPNTYVGMSQFLDRSCTTLSFVFLYANIM